MDDWRGVSFGRGDSVEELEKILTLERTLTNMWRTVKYPDGS
jgi:hypothetical protein